VLKRRICSKHGNAVIIVLIDNNALWNLQGGEVVRG
jgi:hypothetical protein